MKYQKGLIQKNLEILREKEWYRQRFDGCYEARCDKINTR